MRIPKPPAAFRCSSHPSFMPNTNPAKMKNPPQSPALSGFQPQNHPLDSTKTQKSFRRSHYEVCFARIAHTASAARGAQDSAQAAAAVSEALWPVARHPAREHRSRRGGSFGGERVGGRVAGFSRWRHELEPVAAGVLIREDARRPLRDLRQRGGGGVGGIVRQRLPARAVRRVEPEGRREVVDPGFLRVGVVAVLALLEEALRHHLAGERGAILLFGDLVEVLAERVEASRARPYIPPTPRRAFESYWRQHPIRADKLARALAALSGAP